MVTPDDREIIGGINGKVSAPNRSPVTLKSSINTYHKRPLENRHTASMKELPGTATSTDKDKDKIK
jgi:hypothetical protein